jgi:hypothetical protein
VDVDQETADSVDKTAENMDIDDEPPTNITNDLKLKFLSNVVDSRPCTPVDGSFTSTPTSQTPHAINPCVRILAKAVLQVLFNFNCSPCLT